MGYIYNHYYKEGVKNAKLDLQTGFFVNPFYSAELNSIYDTLNQYAYRDGYISVEKEYNIRMLQKERKRQ